MDKKQIRGVLGSLSSQVASRFKMTDSAYDDPIESLIYFRAWGIVLSGHQHLQKILSNKSAASTTLCPATALSSSKYHNSVKNKIKGKVN